jgi:Holliday junction resolvasome RuvABC endonuclease subunit
MIVLGLDVSMTNTGWVVAVCDSDNRLFLKACGVIQTEKLATKEKVSNTVDTLRRAAHIHDELETVCSKHNPVLICAESMSWPRNAGSAIKMSAAWGAISPLLMKHPLIEVGPQAIKKVLTGSRSATKEEVEQAAKQRLAHSHQSIPLLESSVKKALREHCWDALGSVLASQETERWKLIQAGYFRRPS